MDVYSKQKHVNGLIIVCIIVFVNRFVYSLYQSINRVEIQPSIRTIETNKNRTWTETKTTTGSIVLNKQPVKLSTSTNWTGEIKTQTKTKSVLGTVSAWYDWETEYERVRNQIIKLWVDSEIAEHIVWEAYANTDNPKLFVKNIIGVSMAEGSVFKNGLYNNYLGVMKRDSDGGYSLRHYATVQEGISERREIYNRNKRFMRTTAQKRLDWHYCTSACLYWIQNYNNGIYLLNI